MTYAPDTEIVDGVTFELRPHARTPTQEGWVCLRKNRLFTDRYLQLAEEFRGSRVVEVGVDQGGSTSFLTMLLKPERMVAIEIEATPVQAVTEFLAAHDPDQRVTIHWGVDQSDRVQVPRLIDDAFGSNRLDLVIDDASHLREPSTATFEMLFPRLRPGGAYIIEDWSWNHQQERAIAEALETDTDGSLGRQLQDAATDAPEFEQPMSMLICHLVIAAGCHPEWIADLRVTDDFCELRRGPAEIPPGTALSDYVGALGSQMFGSLPG